MPRSIFPFRQTMEELWDRPQQAGRDYFQLGVEEIIMITSAKEQGEFGAYFAVASSPLAGGVDLHARFEQTYAPLTEEIREVSKADFSSLTMKGYEITYQRPWGEPWWKFRDVWVEHDAVLYLLSFHTAPNSFAARQTDLDFILQSFQFK